MAKTLLVTVPVFGQIEYTHALVGDLEREGVDYMIVDNKGDYSPVADERVHTPGRNTGWAGGSNLGFRTAFAEGYDAGMTLNNDVRISRGFFDGILDERLPDDAGAVVGVYDDGAHFAMHSEHEGPAAEYEPRDAYRELAVCDGTALMLTREAFVAVGELDERTFGRFAWGADVDLSLRLREEGFRIVATERSFLNHFGRRTADVVAGRRRYQLFGGFSMSRGLKRIYGRHWSRRVAAETVDVLSLDDHTVLHTTSLADRSA
ncbi:glycosyltransferase family 2 protein [Williamsia herbipolensis]|uniref:Glycosyltransferase family 2 protein n=1 Tax=Williamsia herbipolensis TaxID=1603258 RepID=A0AAU4JX09_9NOCA|nr:glycosyltransferase family 2 protein [Williamsia herbipolensis]